MEYLLSAREMKGCDERTVSDFHVPAAVLMERAALSVAEEIEKRLTKQDTVLFLCGAGNNGGDGYAAARILAERGFRPWILPLKPPAKGSLPEQELLSARSYGIKELSALPEEPPRAVVDAIFGTGLSRDIEGEPFHVIETVNAWETLRIAVDLPSGVSADHGKILGIAFQADITVTFAFRKLGQLLFPGAACCGEVLRKDIGILESSFSGSKPRVLAYGREDLSLLPKRTADTNKGDYGKLLIIAGSPGMCGAAVFAAKAAYRMGVGLVRVYTPEENRSILQQAVPEAVLTTYRSDRFDEKGLIEAIHAADTVLIGPGLGTGAVSEKLLRTTMDTVSCPLVIDADGLNLLARETEQLKRPHTDMVLTPHIGEMARLTGDAPIYLKEERLSRAEEFANEYNVVLAMKDSRTVTAVPYGSLYLNLTGNHGMATAGSGDVLSGIIAALIATGLRAEKAAPLGVYIHGLAGDLAAEKKSARGLNASDLLDSLCDILRETERVTP